MPHVEFRDDRGVKWPSVTTVLDVANQAWKWSWFERQVRQHGWRGWQKCLAKSNRGAHIGTDVHGLLYNRLVDQFKIGQKEPVTLVSGKRHHAHVEQIVEVMFQWVKKMAVKPLALELHIVNNEFFYHGTMDGVFQFSDGHIEIFDWKTSDNPSDTHPLQLSAYAASWNRQNPKQQTDIGRIVRVSKKLKTPKVCDEVYQNLSAYFPLFVGLRMFYDYQHGQGHWEERVQKEGGGHAK